MEKVAKIHGFVFTPEEEAMARAAVREAVRFMQHFGKGVRPRLHGEYYSPGTAPRYQEEEGWLRQETAALYCGIAATELDRAARRGSIDRRVYARRASRCYYEYRIADLDTYINRHGLA